MEFTMDKKNDSTSEISPTLAEDGIQVAWMVIDRYGHASIGRRGSKVHPKDTQFLLGKRRKKVLVVDERWFCRGLSPQVQCIDAAGRAEWIANHGFARRNVSRTTDIYPTEPHLFARWLARRPNFVRLLGGETHWDRVAFPSPILLAPSQSHDTSAGLAQVLAAATILLAYEKYAEMPKRKPNGRWVVVGYPETERPSMLESLCDFLSRIHLMSDAHRLLQHESWLQDQDHMPLMPLGSVPVDSTQPPEKKEKKDES